MDSDLLIVIGFFCGFYSFFIWLANPWHDDFGKSR